jgi:hypothetical protein
MSFFLLLSIPFEEIITHSITCTQILFVNIDSLKGHCEGLLVSMNDLDKKDLSTLFISIGFAFQGRETRDMVMHLEMSQS